MNEITPKRWRKRDGEDDDPWENHGPDGYQPPSYEPVNPEQVKALALRLTSSPA